MKRAVSITSQPNTEFFLRLLESVGVRSFPTYERKREVGRVTFSVPDAMRIQIFNPLILTHRRKLLEKLAKASTYPRHWPSWLEEKVQGLIRRNLGTRAICETILRENNVFIKMHTVRKKMEMNADGMGFGKPRLGFGPKTFALPRQRSSQLSYRGTSPHRPRSIFNL